jgi:nucleoside-diphosphate-sugar epimerase
MPSALPATNSSSVVYIQRSANALTNASNVTLQRELPRKSSCMAIHVSSLSSFPWWLVRLAAPFVTTFRELLEMRYLWRQPVRMSNTRLISALGYEPHTPLDEAVEQTLLGLGCIA